MGGKPAGNLAPGCGSGWAVPALTWLHEGQDTLGLAASLQLVLLQLVAVEAEAHHHVPLRRRRRAQLLESLSSHRAHPGQPEREGEQ